MPGRHALRRLGCGGPRGGGREGCQRRGTYKCGLGCRGAMHSGTFAAVSLEVAAVKAANGGVHGCGDGNPLESAAQIP